jgi:hypothetical protein
MKIVLATYDDWRGDWQGLYVDGTLVREDHRINLRDAMAEIEGHFLQSFKQEEVDCEWFEQLGSFPSNINDVVWSD